MHPSWLWLLYRRAEELPISQTPTSSGFYLAFGPFSPIGTSTLLEPSPLSLSTFTKVGACGQSSQFSPLLVSSFRRSFQLNMFHSIPRCVLSYLLPTGSRIKDRAMQNPTTDINPEQTTSWFSFLFFFFLDGIIFKASRVSHLPAEEFPPLADYDWATHLVKKSFPVRLQKPHICCLRC